MSKLFSSIRLRDLEIRNRVFVAPMCQYSATDGVPNDWHLVHLGTRASGGAGLVISEATAVSPEGRISPWDLGIWNEDQAQAFRRVTDFVRSQGAVPAIQLAHAGRKASVNRPWLGGGLVSPEAGGWVPVAPSAVPYSEALAVPEALSVAAIDTLVGAWGTAAERARTAGFDVVELHFAHGYLAHEFLSPISNHREDAYGGSPENRSRFALEIARTVRSAWPAHLPVFARISASEYVEGGWDLEGSVALCRSLKEIGIDFIDVSSGGNSPAQRVEPAPGYQVPFAAAIRDRVGIPTGAVGLITEAVHAEEILQEGHADAILLARELLRDPYWPLHAAVELGDRLGYWPDQYLRGAVYPEG